jgi:methylated-DNA-protein-cysteine methyltransferase-like protein
MVETRNAPYAADATSSDRASSSTRSAFYAAVFALVSQIPVGRVTTYGTIAHTLGRPTGARSVGWALSIAPVAANLPCHRVVNHEGYLSGGWHWGHPDIMAGLLRDEGVPFLEPHRVDLRACLWIPDDDLIDGHAGSSRVF